jgi:hypothetical protein
VTAAADVKAMIELAVFAQSDLDYAVDEVWKAPTLIEAQGAHVLGDRLEITSGYSRLAGSYLRDDFAKRCQTTAVGLTPNDERPRTDV